MLIALAFHQVGTGKYATKLSTLKAHLQFLKNEFQILKAPQFSRSSTPQILLTFDDATCDFFFEVFPLLQELDMPALLSVPTGFIKKRASLPSSFRLNYLKTSKPFSSNYTEAFCTYEELKIMQASNLITFAAHGHLHKDLRKSPDIQELITSKLVLQDELGVVADTFVFPYGGFNKELLDLAQKEYRYLMRLGNATNYYDPSPYIYRIIADNQPSLTRLFTKGNLAKFFCKELINRLRNR